MLELAREERTCLPLWGKWIEIVSYINLASERLCLPLWGKWIEIWNPIVTATRHARVFPCGGSGLKYDYDRL